MSLSEPFAIRRATLHDRLEVGDLLDDVLEGASYTELPRHHVGLAFAGDTDESQMIVAERDGRLIGLAAYGIVAGSIGAGKVHLVGVIGADRRRGLGRAMLERAGRELAGMGARLVIAELPGDRALRAVDALFASAGFREEARVGGYYRDDVDLVVVRRDLARDDEGGQRPAMRSDTRT